MATCDIKKLITELSILGRITTGYKINTKGDTIVLDNSTWYQGALRTYRGDDRRQTIDFLNNLVSNSNKLCDEILLGKKDNFVNIPVKEFITLFLAALNRAIQGLSRLCTTYNQDPGMAEEINMSIVILNTIMCKLSDPNRTVMRALTVNNKLD